MMNAASNVAEAVLGKKETSTPSQPLVDETRKMHALCWHGKKDVRYLEKPVPRITDPKDIVLKVSD